MHGLQNLRAARALNPQPKALNRQLEKGPQKKRNNTGDHLHRESVSSKPRVTSPGDLQQSLAVLELL